MSKTYKKGLAPALRFPEFRDAGEWVDKKFGELCYFVRGPFGGTLKKDIFVSDGHAVYEQSHAIYDTFDSFRYFITEKKYQELSRFSVKAGDIIMSCSGTMGKFAIIPDNYRNGVINQALLKLTVKVGCNLEFMKHTLELPANQEKLLSQSAGGAIKNVVGVGLMKEIKLPMPTLQEQQKIADCLGSLDALIAAHTQKHQALQSYKKGLMQNLFPAQADDCMDAGGSAMPDAQAATVPALRFPEFRDAGEWVEKPLNKISEIVMGASPKSSAYNHNGVGFPLLQGNADIKNRLSAPRIFTSEITKECVVGDILLSVRAPVGTVAKSNHNACIGRGIAAIRASRDNNQEFIYQWLLNFEPFWSDISQGGTFDAVNSDDIRKLLTPVPKKEEQQKIADCLSSVDDLITAQAEKIVALKAHKKGLMQQLFPAPADRAI